MNVMLRELNQCLSDTFPLYYRPGDNWGKFACDHDLNIVINGGNYADVST